MKPANQFLFLLAAIGLAAAVTVVNHGNGDLYTLDATQDSWIDDDNVNHGNSDFLLAGLLPSSQKTRYLVQFEDLPSACTTIKWAKLYMFFADANIPGTISVTEAPYIERDLEVHQVIKSWSELQVTRKLTGIGTEQWITPGLGLDDTDASSIVQDTVRIFTDQPPSFVRFDVTQAMNEWKSGEPNNGLVVRATNENTVGRNLRFYSQEVSQIYRRPIIKVLCN